MQLLHHMQGAQAIMTIPDDIPILPIEIAELVLLHLPAALVDAADSRTNSLSLAKCTWWAYCILPSGLPKSSLRHAAIKFTAASTIRAWIPMFSDDAKSSEQHGKREPIPGDSLINILVRWYRVTDNVAHMHAAFDCALTQDRTDVLDMWIQPEHGLPQRTGTHPQLPLPLASVLDAEAFDAVAWVYEHLRTGFRSGAVADFAKEWSCNGDAELLDTLITCMGGNEEFLEVVGHDAWADIVYYAAEGQHYDVLDVLGEL